MRRHIVLLLTLALVAAGCADESNSVANSDSPTTTVGAPATASGISDEAHETRPLFATPVWTPSAVNPLAATLELATIQAVELRLTATAGDHRVTTPWTAEPAQEHTLPLVGLRSDRTYDVRIEARLPNGEIDHIDSSFTTGALPENIPDLGITIDTDRAAPGVTILELNPVQAVRDGIGNPIIAVDSDGEVIWYYQSQVIAGAFTGAVSRGPNGTVYAQNHPFGAREFTIDGRLVRAISADPTGEAEITPIEGGGLNVPYHAEWIDLRTVHHDISPMPDNTVIF
ncbi:MAG TPA: hypothetical protein DCE75_03300, partial [Acidimicrobiaceae bacterium]|nr:hypothetical protein [Acidimicrobiaceae bacterium]